MPLCRGWLSGAGRIAQVDVSDEEGRPATIRVLYCGSGGGSAASLARARRASRFPKIADRVRHEEPPRRPSHVGEHREAEKHEALERSSARGLDRTMRPRRPRSREHGRSAVLERHARSRSRVVALGVWG
jgi:hypothetical protein